MMSNEAEQIVSHSIRLARDSALLDWCADTKGALALPQTNDEMVDLRREFYSLPYEARSKYSPRPTQAHVAQAREYLQEASVEIGEELARYSDMIRGAILEVIPSLSYSDVDDLEQDVALKAWASLDSYDYTKSKIQTWLHRKAQDVAVDYLRMQEAQFRPSLVFEHELPEAADLDGEPVPYYDRGAAAEASAEEEVSGREQLQIGLGCLTESEARVFQCMWVDSQSAEECAETLGVSWSTVRVHVKNIRDKLSAGAI